MGGVLVSAGSGKERNSCKKLPLKEFRLTRNPGFRRRRIKIS